MRMIKKLSAIALTFAMCMSLLSGFAVKASAAVTTELPKVNGLYKAEWFNFEWDEATQKSSVRTDKDAAGNTVVVDGENQFIRWQDQDQPDYLTNGVKEGWGFGVAPVDEFWFDYIKDGKVKHVSYKDLKFTHLDGSAYPEAVFSANEEDSRIVKFTTTKLDPILVTYSGAKENNKMILCPELTRHFYSTAEKSIDSFISSDINVVKDKTKDIYLHLTDGWEGARFSIDPATALEVIYWNDNGEEKILSGTEAAAIVAATPVSIDNPNNMVFKLTVSGKYLAENNNRFDIRCKFKMYDVSDPNSTWDDEQRVSVNVVEGNTLLATEDWNLALKGSTYSVRDVYNYNRNVWLETYGKAPIYSSLKFVDADGNVIYVTDPADLTFYTSSWDDEKQTRVVGEKYAEAPFTVTRVGSSNILKFTANATEYTEAVVGYKDFAVNGDECICLRYGTDREIQSGIFKSKTADSDTYVKEIKTTGLADTTVYAAYSKGDDWIKSGKLREVNLIDEDGNNLSSKVKVTDESGVLFPLKTATTFASKVVIPEGTLKSSARLELVYDVVNGDGQNEDRNISAFIVCNPVGATFTSGNVTYVVKTKSEVAVKSVKTSLKTVTIPATVNGFKVTAINAKAMNGCKKLKTITVKSTNIKTVGSNAFKGVKKTAVAKVPKAKKSAYQKLFKKAGFKGKYK